MKVDAAQMMEAGPPVSGCRSRYQTAAKLLGLNVPVVSVGGKGPVKGQVSDGKMNANEPLMRRRNHYMMSEPMSSIIIGISTGGTCLLPVRHPAYRRHDSIIGICAERENLSSRCEGKATSRRHGKGDSTDAWHGGGTPCSSDEDPVMGMERRGRIIWHRSMTETAKGVTPEQEVRK